MASNTPASKRLRSEASAFTESPEKSYTEALDSIDQKLTSLDGRLALVEVLHKEFQALRESLEFTQQQVESLTAENQTLKQDVKKLTEGMTQLSGDNKKLKEFILGIQAGSMRDTLVFSAIREQQEDDPETADGQFILQNLKHPTEEVKKIAFHRVHRNGDLEEMLRVKVESPEETSHSVVPEVSESYIKEEEKEEVWIGQEEKQLCVKEENSTASFPVSTTSIKSEDDAETPLFSQPHEHLKVSEDDEKNRNVNQRNSLIETCSDCGKQFTKHSLENHKKKRCPGALDNKECIIVEKTVDSQNTVETSPTSFPCDDCGKTFNKEHNLIKHKRIHTGEKPFQCDLCDRSFGQSSYLKKHRATHKPFPCDLCGQTFFHKPQLDTHRRTHTEHYVLCDLCELSFSEKSSLDRHMVLHNILESF